MNKVRKVLHDGRPHWTPTCSYHGARNRPASARKLRIHEENYGIIAQPC
jgi:hypothetical protein